MHLHFWFSSHGLPDGLPTAAAPRASSTTSAPPAINCAASSKSSQRLAASSPAAETSASASESGGGAAVFSGKAPEEAGEIDSASMWWYRDSEGADHGPYPVEQMRAWLAAGYFDGSTQVAASYFGEVRRFGLGLGSGLG